MKKILLLATFLLSMVPAMAEELTGEVAESYSKIVDGWTYITNAKEFMKLVQECQDPNVGEKKIRLACEIEYPDKPYYEIPTYYIKYFNGVFDGMGCSIKFHILTRGRDDDDIDVAFIQELKGSNSEVCNLRFDNCFVKSNSNGRNAALVVGKVTATRSSFHDIYVEGGTIEGADNIGALGGLICKINSNTTIDHCAFFNTDIDWSGHENSYAVGFFGDGFIDDSDIEGCSVSNCYIASTPRVSPIMAKFSCRRELTDKEKDKGMVKYPNCYYTDDCKINGGSTLSVDFINNVTSITLSSLISGIGSGWKYSEDVVPQPEGIYYWVPSQTYNLTIGTHGSSQSLQGSVTPIDYGRFLNATQLKLTGITSAGSEDYVINDYYTNEIGVENPIKAIAENVFRNISMTTLQLPGGVTTVEGTSFHHGVTEGFISNGNWRFAGNLLYLNTNDFKRLMTVVGDNEELTIDGRYCTEILDEALKTQSNLKDLYINTWFPADATAFPPIQLMGENVFSGDPEDLDLKVYVKDGTTEQLIIGEDIEHGYKDYNSRWTGFYSEWGDNPNRLFQYYPVTRNPAGLSTIMLGYPVKLPSDCKAWVATSIGDGELVLKRVKGDIVPALLSVLLSYEKKDGIMHLTPYEGNAPSATQYEGSIFKGSIDPAGHKMTDSEMMTNFLTLSRPKGDTSWDNVGFYSYHPTNKILPSYVAWISIQDLPAKLAMVFDGDYELADPTGITDISESVVNSSTPVYNLSGQRVGSSYRGMIIKNGRKYIAK